MKEKGKPGMKVEKKTLSEEKKEEIVKQRKLDAAWERIFETYKLYEIDFTKDTFLITAPKIKAATNNQEPRILCKQDSREDRPAVFRERGLFILPVINGQYVILAGEGYIDIPPIDKKISVYKSKLDFALDTSKVGHSEMQHLDFAYASSLVRTFMKDETLVLTIRGRKFTPEFSFRVGRNKVQVKSVQTEVDAGYEGKKQVVLIEAKASTRTNTIIRQMFYPFRQWQSHTTKPVVTLFFEKSDEYYSFWQFEFTDENDYNSIKLVRTCKYEIADK
jgi:uncharacterized protein DUF6997/uncharacterized protein DUF6996